MYLLRLFHGRPYFSEVSIWIIVNQRRNFKGEHSLSAMQLYRRDVTHSRLENRVWSAGTQAWGWGGGTAQSSQPAVSWDRTPGRLRGGNTFLGSSLWHPWCYCLYTNPGRMALSRLQTWHVHSKSNALNQFPGTHFWVVVCACHHTDQLWADGCLLHSSLIRRNCRTENIQEPGLRMPAASPGKHALFQFFKNLFVLYSGIAD